MIRPTEDEPWWGLHNGPWIAIYTVTDPPAPFGILIDVGPSIGFNVSFRVGRTKGIHIGWIPASTRMWSRIPTWTKEWNL